MQSLSPIFQSVERTFKKMEWACRRVENREILEADFEVYHTKVRLHVQAFAELNAVSIVATAGSPVPESRLGLISEMLMRTNQELSVGNFELDYDGGRVLFRATNIFPAGHEDGTIIASLVHSALAEMDRVTPFLTLALRMTTEELGKLNIKLFLQREDLLPPVPENPSL
jgi:hypothetical protein